MVDELRDMVMRIDGRHFVLEPSEQESVVPAALLLGDVCSLSDFLKGSDDIALSAGHVYGGGGDTLDGATSDKAFADDAPIQHRSGLQDVPWKIEFVGDLCQF